jgi:translation initiation factor 2-alpha kinase 4
MGTAFLAEPVCDDIHASLPLELYVTVFNSEYYTTSQGTYPAASPPYSANLEVGKKKLKQIESEISKLVNVRHPNLLCTFAVKLFTPHSDYPRLVILSEERPPLRLRDVLEDCDTLKEDRAAVCFRSSFISSFSRSLRSRIIFAKY